MKRLMIISLFLTVFATGCFFYEEAETVNPEDVTSTNTGTAPGGVTTFTATTTIANVSMTNPYVRINFSTPADETTISCGNGNSISLEFNGTPLAYPGDYTADPNPATLTEAPSVINLIINSGISAGGTLRIILTNAIQADANNTVSLTPVDNSQIVGN